MNTPAGPSDEHATPIEPQEAAQLVPSFITTRDELNRAEQRAITEVTRLVLRNPPAPDRLLDVAYLLALHKRMFGPVWKWAGKVRTTERNIGRRGVANPLRSAAAGWRYPRVAGARQLPA